MSGGNRLSLALLPLASALAKSLIESPDNEELETRALLSLVGWARMTEVVARVAKRLRVRRTVFIFGISRAILEKRESGEEDEILVVDGFPF